MAKFKIIFTASRELTPAQIREIYGDTLELEEGDDPVEKLVEYFNDNGTDAFADETMTDWDHGVVAEPAK